jgi:hypothetical protein
MRRTVFLLGVIALVTSARLPAQERDTVPLPMSHVPGPTTQFGVVERGTWDVRRSMTWDVGRAVVHWGKWLAAAGAVAFTLMGSHEHEHSNREFGRLLAVCRADSVDCRLGPDGSYVNPESERLYQASIRHDRRARARLIAGQAGLLVAAALFVADLRHEGDGPVNKPFAPLEVAVDERTGGAQVGLRWTF